MKLTLTIAPLTRAGLTPRQIAALMLSDLGVRDVSVAYQRLLRTLSERSHALRKDVVNGLCRIASERHIDWRELLRVESQTLFDLLPRARTTIYLGAHGKADRESAKYTESITASVNDYRAALCFARRIGPDLKLLRFAPSIGTSQERIVEIGRARERDCSRVCVGSSKINTLSEYAMAGALGLVPFRPQPVAGPQAPVRFVYAVSPGERRTLSKSKRYRCNAWFRDAAQIGHSHLHWDSRQYQYKPPKGATDGTDYAVVAVHARGPSIGDVVVSGLTGTATLGASLLMCQVPELLGLPDAEQFTRLFLIEVGLREDISLRIPTVARIVGRWTRDHGAFENFDTSQPVRVDAPFLGAGESEDF